MLETVRFGHAPTYPETLADEKDARKNGSYRFYFDRPPTDPLLIVNLTETDFERNANRKMGFVCDSEQSSRQWMFTVGMPGPLKAEMTFSTGRNRATPAGTGSSSAERKTTQCINKG